MTTTARGRLLVVDDDLVLLATMHAILADHFDVATAKSAREGLTKLSMGEFDVLVTDYEMPDGTGVELLRYATERAGGGIYTILLTGKSGYAEVRALQKNGVLVLFKPIDPEELTSWVKNGVAMAQLSAASRRLRATTETRRRDTRRTDR